jgi:hypothetical protein
MVLTFNYVFPTYLVYVRRPSVEARAEAREIEIYQLPGPSLSVCDGECSDKIEYEHGDVEATDES